MAEFVTKIRTADGDKAIDYNYLEHKPKSDETLSVEGSFADAKAVGEKLAEKADITYVDEEIQAAKEDTAKIDTAISTLEESINATLETKADITYVDENTSILKATEAEEGKILRVVKVVNEEDATESWKTSWETASSALDATQDDNGKILAVVDGISKWVSPADAFAITSGSDSEGGEDDGDTTVTDNDGKILTVVGGKAQWETASCALSALDTHGDSQQINNGDFLRFYDGVAMWYTVPNAEESGF